MEDEEGPAGAAEGYLKGKYYVRQIWGKKASLQGFLPAALHNLVPYIRALMSGPT